MGRRGFAFSAFTALLLLSGAARASSGYPDIINQQLGAACKAPDCTICHETSSGGMGTAKSPFAMELTNLGLTGNNPAALRMLLDQLRTLDPGAIQALKACMDPNKAPVFVPGSGDGGDDGGATSAGSAGAVMRGSGLPTPQYGCAIQQAPRGTRFAASLLAAGVLAWRRRRGRRP
jgi:hypothetical protein